MDHEWLRKTLLLLGKLLSKDFQVAGVESGYCCLKHELEFGPTELELVRVSIHPGDVSKPLGRDVYNVIVQEAGRASKHKVVHLSMYPDGFLVALKPYP